MRYVILGARGMLGTDLARTLHGRDVVAASREDADLADPESLAGIVTGADIVINTAAYTRVDDAEEHEEEALAVNGTGAGNAAAAAAAIGARFVQISTDYVFDGTATTPYPEDAPLRPLGAYGRSKARGEELSRERHPAPHIVRTAWLYGAHGPNFARTMARLAHEREHVDVVTDQVGQPTWTRDLARAVVALLDADAPAGVYHGTGTGTASWLEFARAVFTETGHDPARVRPTTSAAYPRPAPRPAYSVLGHEGWRRAGLAPMPHWRDALARAAAEGVLAV